MEIVNDWFRELLFSLFFGMNRTSDLLLENLTYVFRMDMAKDLPWMREWMSGISILLLIFIMIRLIFLLIRAIFDEEKMINGLFVVKRLLAIGLVVILLPIGIPYLAKMSSDTITVLSSSLDESTLKPSDMILANISEDEKVREVLKKQDAQQMINEIDEEGNYVYLPEYFDLFEILLIATAVLYCMVRMFLQFMKRLFDLCMKMLIVPYTLSGMIDEHDGSFGVWLRSCMSDLLANLFQVYGVMFVMYSVSFIDLKGLMGSLLMIAGLLVITELPGKIESYSASDTTFEKTFSVLPEVSLQKTKEKTVETRQMMLSSFAGEREREERTHAFSHAKTVRESTGFYVQSEMKIHRLSYGEKREKELKFYDVGHDSSGGMALNNAEILLQYVNDVGKKERELPFD